MTVYPADTTAEEIIASNPDGIMLSNGPGDPAECTSIIKEIKKLYETDIPIFASPSFVPSFTFLNAGTATFGSILSSSTTKP